MSLKNLSNAITELSQTNSSSAKIEILKNYSDIKEYLYYTYYTHLQYYVTSTNIEKVRNNIVIKKFEGSLFDLLKKLSNRELTGHEAISYIEGFIQDQEEYRELIYNIIDRNLKVRIDSKLINKAFPDLIPEFSVVLAKNYDDYIKKVDFKKDQWYSSRKLDGIRLITIIENGNISFYSRTGNQNYNLNVLENEIRKYNIQNDLVLDGELCIVDEQGNENFKGIQSLFTRKDYQIQNPVYMIFDLIRINDFYKTSGEESFSQRQHNLENFINIFSQSKYIKKVEQKIINSLEELKKEKEAAVNQGWEGLILRKNIGYEGKRTNALLKVKNFLDAEFTVKALEYGPYRIIDSKTGLEKTIETLTNVIIEYKGNHVSVGSGFSLEQRAYFYINPGELVGSEITVQYFEETKDKNGKPSLRFPTVKAVYNGKRKT
jgi:DNA ligase-1